MTRKYSSKYSDEEILDFINKHIEEKGYPPTNREIGDSLGGASTSVVNYRLERLVEKGRITRASKVSRGIRVVV